MRPTMENQQHRLAAVWFADIVGYTRQATEDEERALRVVHAFQEAVRDVIRRHGGRIVKFIGDAAMTEFSSTESAVRAASRLARACTERAAAAGVECPTLRIAVHVGDVTTTPDGDVYGDGVNVAARIVREVVPGELWVSEDVWRQLRHRPRFRFEERGARELKGMEPVRVYAVIGGQGEEAEESRGPGARARALFGELRRRNVGRVAIVYAVVGWLVIQVVAATFPTLGLPAGLGRTVMLLVILGFPVAVVLAWAYELTPQGLRRTGSTPADGRPVGRRGLVRQGVVAAVLIAAVSAWLLFGPENPLESEASGGDGSSALPMGDPARVAVLYFDDHSEGRRLEYLASGITEALIHDLAQIEALEVIPRTGVKAYRDATVPVDSIARALGAGTLIEGSVAQSGDRVRVIAQLIDAADMSHLASVEVERPRGELFDLQDELVADVLRELRPRLGEEIQLRITRRATANVEAWELVQRASELRDRARRSSGQAGKALLDQADSLLARAEELDPMWVDPVLHRGRLAAETDEDPGGALQRGLAHVARALGRDPESAQALGLRGELEYRLAGLQPDSVRTADWLTRAERDLSDAVAADPSLASAWITLADLLYNAKWDLPRARDAARRAYEADAFQLQEDHFKWLCEISMQLKDFDEANRWCAEGRRRFSPPQRLVVVQLYVLASKGVEPDPDAAWRLVDELGQLPESETNVPIGHMVTAAVLARAGLRDSALDVAQRAREAMPSDYAFYTDYLESYVRLVLGDRNAALRLLGEFLSGHPEYRSLIARDYWFEDLSDDPRFERLVDRKRWPIYCLILCEPPPDL